MIFDLQLLPFFISMTVLTVIVLVIGMHIWRNFYAMLVIIPLALFCALVGYKTITELLGYSINQPIPEHSLYLSHIESSDGDGIFVWIIEPGQDKPKNVKIPGTENNKKQLNQAKRNAQNGIKQGLESKKGRLGDGNGGEYLIYDFHIKHLPQKNQ